MGDPIHTPNSAEFGSYENYLAARVGGIRATRGMSRVEITGHFAKTDGDEDGGEGPVVVDKTGRFVNLSNGSLRELQTDLWGDSVWGEMYEVARARRASAAPSPATPRGGYFPSYGALATQGRSLSECWNPAFSRMHNGTSLYAAKSAW